MSDIELRNLFPGWATEDAIMKSMEMGNSHPTPPIDPEIETCPFSENLRACYGTDLYWNELACMCLHLEANYNCPNECENNMVFDPSQVCTCVDPEFVNQEIFKGVADLDT